MKGSSLWAAYARAQEELASRQVVDSRSWGLEAGLERLLETLTHGSAQDELDRAVRTGSRGERHRARLRRIHHAALDFVHDLERQLGARRDLQAVRERTSDGDWSLLVAIAEGRDYSEVAGGLGAAPGGLRVRILRLRRELRAPTDRRAA